MTASQAGPEATDDPLGGARPWDLWLRRAIVAMAAFHVLVVVVVFAARFRHPFENSWLEALVLEHVRRILSGQPLFVAPSLDYIPLIYTPLYYHAGALLDGLLGGGFATLRGLSMACSAAAMALVFLMVRRESGSTIAAAASVGLLAACYKMNGYWFDLARVDPMMLCLALAGLYVTRFGASIGTAVAAGLLFGLAFLTKQTSLALTVPVLLWAAVRDWRRGGIQGAVMLGVAGGASSYWQSASGGWYGYYVLELPSRHGLSPGMLVHAATDLLPLPLAIAFVLGAYFLLANGRRNPATWFYVLAAAGGIAGSAVSLSKWAGYSNALLQAHSVVAILFGLGFHAVLRDLAAVQGAIGERLRSLAWLAVAWQLATLVANPLPAIPPRVEARTGDALVAALRQVQGDVFFPDQPYLLVLAGKRSHAHEMQIADVLMHAADAERDRLLSEIDAAARGRWAAVVAHPEEQIPERHVDYWAMIADQFRPAPELIPAALLRVRMDAGRFMQNHLFVAVDRKAR
jgi:hypothetical protein